jgi:hypothetical protein
MDDLLPPKQGKTNLRTRVATINPKRQGEEGDQQADTACFPLPSPED